MVTFKIDFSPNAFERRMIQQTKEDVQARLRGHELGRLMIVLKKAGHRVAFQFLGEPEGVDKAKGLLGMC
ncbi:MAG: hypothetical protein ACJ8M1_05440 [Chthoniobacterales bacterium]